MYVLYSTNLIIGRPEQSHGLSTNTVVLHLFDHSLPPLDLQRCQAQTIRDGASSHQKGYVTQSRAYFFKGYPI